MTDTTVAESSPRRADWVLPLALILAGLALLGSVGVFMFMQSRLQNLEVQLARRIGQERQWLVGLTTAVSDKSRTVSGWMAAICVSLASTVERLRNVRRASALSRSRDCNRAKSASSRVPFR
jgi:hypothetical protein